MPIFDLFEISLNPSVKGEIQDCNKPKNDSFMDLGEFVLIWLYDEAAGLIRALKLKESRVFVL